MVRFTLKEIEGSLRWVAVNLSPVVFGDKELTAVGKIRQSSDGDLYAYDNSVSGERKVQYQYTVDSVQEILSMKLELGDRIKVKGSGAEYLVQADSVAGYNVDTIAVVPSNAGYAVLQPIENKINISTIWNGDLEDNNNIYKALGFVKVKGYCLFFPAGEYQFPSDFQFDFGNNTACILGPESGEAIITTSATKNIQYTERINLDKGVPNKDGYYIANIVPADTSLFNEDYDHLKSLVNIGDYIKIENGIPSITSRDSAAANGYLVELSNVDETEPTQDGLYAINEVYLLQGGSYQHTEFKFDNSIYVYYGSIVELSNGQWSRYNPSWGFIFRGDGFFKDLTFKNFSPYIFSPFGQNINKEWVIEDCTFDNVTRVLSLQTSGASPSIPGVLDSLNSRLHKTPGCFSCKDATVVLDWSFDLLKIENCTFENIIESSFWGMPPTKKTIIKNNIYQNNYFDALFFHMFWSDKIGEFIFKDNFIYNSIMYKKVGALGNYQFIKCSANSTISGNVYKNTDRFRHFIGGGDNYIGENLFTPYLEFNDLDSNGNIIDYNAFFRLKTGNNFLEKTSFVDQVSNNTVMGGLVNFVQVQKDLHTIDLKNNTFLASTSRRYITEKTEFLDPIFSYIVYDTLKLKELTFINQSINIEDRIYFSYQDKAWRKSESTVGRKLAFVYLDGTTQKVKKVNIDGNKIESNSVIYNALDSAVLKVDILKNEIKNTDVIYGGSRSSSIYKEINLNSNNIDVLGSSTIYSIDDKITSNFNNFYTGFNSNFSITADTILFSNSNLYFKETTSLDELGFSFPTSSYSIAFNSKNLYFSNNYISAKSSSDKAVQFNSRFLQADNNFFDINGVTNKFDREGAGVTVQDGDTVILKNNGFRFYGDAGNARLYEIPGSNEDTLDLLVIDGNYAFDQSSKEFILTSVNKSVENLKVGFNYASQISNEGININSFSKEYIYFNPREVDTLQSPAYLDISTTDTLTFSTDDKETIGNWTINSNSGHYSELAGTITYSGANQTTSIDCDVVISDTDIFENTEVALYIGGVEARSRGYTFTATDTTHTYNLTGIFDVDDGEDVYLEIRYPAGNQSGEVQISDAACVFRREKSSE